jgi:hypothetical protein
VKAEELVALCGARGVDLIGIAKQRSDMAAPKEVRTYQRRGLRSVELLEPSGARAFGKESRSILEREWTVAELCQAAVGVPNQAFLAACFSWAGDRGHFLELHDGLMIHALKFRRTEKWPFQVRGYAGGRVHYLETLCSMVLDEDQHPALFAWRPDQPAGREPAPSMQAIYCGVDEKTWRGSLAGRFDMVRGVFWSWLDTSARMIQARLRDE